MWAAVFLRRTTYFRMGLIAWAGLSLHAVGESPHAPPTPTQQSRPFAPAKDPYPLEVNQLVTKHDLTPAAAQHFISLMGSHWADVAYRLSEGRNPTAVAKYFQEKIDAIFETEGNQDKLDELYGNYHRFLDFVAGRGGLKSIAVFKDGIWSPDSAKEAKEYGEFMRVPSSLSPQRTKEPAAQTTKSTASTFEKQDPRLHGSNASIPNGTFSSGSTFEYEGVRYLVLPSGSYKRLSPEDRLLVNAINQR